MSSPRQSQGTAYETQALDYLQKQGLVLVARQWRCRFGEIDLIMRDGATLVFVEVRQRASTAFGGALASVTASKVAKLEATASAYLAASRYGGACRFDVVAIESATQVQWVKNITGA